MTKELIFLLSITCSCSVSVRRGFLFLLVHWIAAQFYCDATIIILDHFRNGGLGWARQINISLVPWRFLCCGSISGLLKILLLVLFPPYVRDDKFLFRFR